MRDAGFPRVRLGPGMVVDGKNVPAPEDVARALELNAEWDRHRRGLPPLTPRLGFPPGSIGDGYHRAMAMREKERERKGIRWTSEQRSRDDWPRAWRHIEPLLGDCDPSSVTPEILQELRGDVAERVSEGEAFRAIKVWRALWQKMVGFRFCSGEDPSLNFANSAPQPRQAVWPEGEAVRLVKEAWRRGYTGLAALLAVAWDSQLSPVDARRLRVGDMRRDPVGTWFEVARAKTVAAPWPRSAREARACCKLTSPACRRNPWQLFPSSATGRAGLTRRTPSEMISVTCGACCSVKTSAARSPTSVAAVPSRH
jgi:hypothetical protein